MKISIRENGSIGIETTGSYTVHHSDGSQETIEKPKFSLCRCNHSQNRPFCDGTHKTIGFEAPGLEIEV